MTDYVGTVSDTLGPDRVNAPGEPKASGIGTTPYPPGPWAVVGTTPGWAPFERVDTDNVQAFGVARDGSAQGPAENAGVIDIDSVLNVGRINQEIQTIGVATIARGQDSDWFEKWHVFPGEIALGNVLSTQIIILEIFNAFRRETRTWQAFTNNAGAGISITNLPALPRDFAPLESFLNNLQVSTNGPPTINGTLDFDVDLDPPDVILVPITGNRITIFQFRPQAPIEEKLEFKTDILAKSDGSEQRINLRRAPRQRITMNYRTDANRTRDTINSILYDWQARVFGVPVWWEAREVQAPLAVNDTLVPVDTTNADFRVGGLVTIYDSNFESETLEIAAIAAGQLTLDVGLQRAYDGIRTLAIPTRTAYTKPQLGQNRYAIGPTDFQIEFLTLDNIELDDAAAFPTYQGTGQSSAKPVIDRLNFLPGNTIAEGHRRRVNRLDTETGPPLQFSPWTKSKILYQYGFEAKSEAELWEFRQLVHFLKGSQLSFYVGTGRTDIRPLADIADLSGVIDFEAIGYTAFVGPTPPRADIQVVRTDGTLSRHQIVGSSEVDASTERITINPQITPALPLAELDRIEFLSLCRIAGDEVRIRHTRPAEARIDIPLVGVIA